MLHLDIPGFGRLALAHLILDYNGTLAIDGILQDCVRPRLEVLAGDLDLHVLTADTRGGAAAQLQGLPVHMAPIQGPDEAAAKAAYLEHLGAGQCAAVGNGANDRLLLGRASLGIAVCQQEGMAGAALLACDMWCRSIADALDLFIDPMRLTATLRS